MAPPVIEKKKYTQEYYLKTPEGEREESAEVYILKDKTYTLYKTYNKDDTLESPPMKDLKIEILIHIELSAAR
jgi:hypothetical protein